MLGQEMTSLEQKKNFLHYNEGKNDILKRVCEPLKQYFNAEWFTRAIFKLNDKDECVGWYGTSTSMPFLESYVFEFNDNGKSFTQVIRETPLHSYSYFIWSNKDNACPLMQMKYQKHGLTKGIAIYKRFKDRIEVWAFGGKDPELPSVITQTSIPIFQDFINYFDKQQLVNQLVSPFVDYIRPFDMSYIQPDLDKIKIFESLTHKKNISLKIDDKSIFLSKREWECLSRFSQGKTYKEVANALSLSSRTIETYLNNIRNKTGISSKSKLIDYFLISN